VAATATATVTLTATNNITDITNNIFNSISHGMAPTEASVPSASWSQTVRITMMVGGCPRVTNGTRERSGTIKHGTVKEASAATVITKKMGGGATTGRAAAHGATRDHIIRTRVVVMNIAVVAARPIHDSYSMMSTQADARRQAMDKGQIRVAHPFLFATRALPRSRRSRRHRKHGVSATMQQGSHTVHRAPRGTTGIRRLRKRERST
jgi:hypothetical protein